MAETYKFSGEIDGEHNPRHSLQVTFSSLLSKFLWHFYFVMLYLQTYRPVTPLCCIEPNYSFSEPLYTRRTCVFVCVCLSLSSFRFISLSPSHLPVPFSISSVPHHKHTSSRLVLAIRVFWCRLRSLILRRRRRIKQQWPPLLHIRVDIW